MKLLLWTFSKYRIEFFVQFKHRQIYLSNAKQSLVSFLFFSGTKTDQRFCHYLVHSHLLCNRCPGRCGYSKINCAKWVQGRWTVFPGMLWLSFLSPILVCHLSLGVGFLKLFISLFQKCSFARHIPAFYLFPH